MSYNLTPKRCHYCGRCFEPRSADIYESAKDIRREAWTFTPMTLARPVFGWPERIEVCFWGKGGSAAECLDRGTADGYVRRPDLIPKR